MTDGRRNAAKTVSGDRPYVLGCCIKLPYRRYRPEGDVVAEFSCHWAAVAALVRLRQPEFRSLDGDREKDLAQEVNIAERIALMQRSYGE